MGKGPAFIYLTLTAAMDEHIAIKYLLTRASQYKINPNYVISGGGSFGGATALMAAFADKSELFTKYNNPDINHAFFNDYDNNVVNNTIKGVLSFYGAILDLNFINPVPTPKNSASNKLKTT